MSTASIRVVFLLSAVYDLVLGLAVLLFGPQLFAALSITPPNHDGYVQFPALLLIVFAALFFRIAGDPAGSHALMPYGIGLKVSYCSVVFWHLCRDAIPQIWVSFAWADLAFLVLFIAAWRATAPRRAAA